MRLIDGRRVEVPLALVSRLLHASPAARENWHLLGDGLGIRWSDVDEDLSVAGLLRTVRLWSLGVRPEVLPHVQGEAAKRHPGSMSVELFLLSLAGSLVTAITCATVDASLQATVDSTAPLFFVFAGAVLFAILVFPFALLSLRNVRLRVAAPIVTGTSLLVIAVTTPFVPAAAPWLAFGATVAAMAGCSWLLRR